MIGFLRPFLQPLGIDLFCFGKKFLVFNLVNRNLKVKYRRSILGVLWTLLVPLSMGIIYYMVFNLFLKVKIPHYLSFILSGVIPFSFFTQSILEGMESIVGNWGLASKIPMPLQIFPYVGTLTNLVTLSLSLPILIGAALISKVSIGYSILVLPFYFLLLFGMSYGLALILAIAFVYFRDLRHLMGIILQIWFYGTPVVYSHSMIPDQFHWILFANPIGSLFVAFHAILVEGSFPQWIYTAVSIGWAVGILFLSALIYKYTAKGMVEQI